jgi:hypothetical protein
VGSKREDLWAYALINLGIIPKAFPRGCALIKGNIHGGGVHLNHCHVTHYVLSWSAAVTGWVLGQWKEKQAGYLANNHKERGSFNSA